MRTRKAFLSMAVLAAGGLFAGTAVTAAELSDYCYTQGNVWKVTLMGPPSVTPCGSASGSCVTATYEVKGTTPDHVAGLMPLALFNVTGTNLQGNQYEYDPGQGDPVFGLGYGDMSRRAFKVNPNGTVSYYTVWLDGGSFGLGLVPVKIKKGTKGTAIEGACALAGPTEIGTNPLATTTPDLYEVLGGKCKVHVHTDPQTGQTTVELDGGPNSQGSCEVFPPVPINDVRIQVGQDTAGNVELSEALTFLVGNGTCAYKQYYPTTGPVYKVCW